jgi:hypothetical protein
MSYHDLTESNVGWVEAHSAETHRLERWVSLTLNPSYSYWHGPPPLSSPAKMRGRIKEGVSVGCD